MMASTAWTQPGSQTLDPEQLNPEAGHLPGIRDIAGIVAQNGVHDGRHKLGGHQVQVLALVHKGLDEAQRALLHLQAGRVFRVQDLGFGV